MTHQKCIVQLKRMLVEEGPDKVKEISDILYKRAKILVDNGVIDASWKAKLKKIKFTSFGAVSILLEMEMIILMIQI